MLICLLIDSLESWRYKGWHILHELHVLLFSQRLHVIIIFNYTAWSIVLRDELYCPPESKDELYWLLSWNKHEQTTDIVLASSTNDSVPQFSKFTMTILNNMEKDVRMVHTDQWYNGTSHKELEDKQE